MCWPSSKQTSSSSEILTRSRHDIVHKNAYFGTHHKWKYTTKTLMDLFANKIRKYQRGNHNKDNQEKMDNTKS